MHHHCQSVECLTVLTTRGAQQAYLLLKIGSWMGFIFVQCVSKRLSQLAV